MSSVIGMRKCDVVENRFVHVDCVREGEELGFGGEGDVEFGDCDGDCLRDGFWGVFVDVEQRGDGERVEGRCMILSGFVVCDGGDGEGE